MTTLLHTLTQLEQALHRPQVRSDARRLDTLLHDTFLEFGRSGARYTKAHMLAHLGRAAQADAETPLIHSQDFDLRLLAPEVALLTYRSAHVNVTGGLARHSLRSSVWLFDRSIWQMAFHQGTACDAFERNPL